MNLRIFFLLGFLGISACHGNTQYATDVDSTLLRSSAESVLVPVTVQGKISCASCATDDGMGVVVSSPLTGSVANGFYNQVGSYSVLGTAKPGDTIVIRITLSRGGSVAGKSATSVVPDGGGTISQDFQFQ